MSRVKRLIAGFLCVVMLSGIVPMEVLAAEPEDQTQNTENYSVSAITDDSKNNVTGTEKNESVQASATEKTDVEDAENVTATSENEISESAEAAPDTVENDADIGENGAGVIGNTTENEIIAAGNEETSPENETGNSENAADTAGSETNVPVSDSNAVETVENIETSDDQPRWIYSVNSDGYAVIDGYTDYNVTELAIPYVLDGYYVTAVGEKAFAANTALTELYVHGNVHSIAENAFDGLNVCLSGYNGTEVLNYASQHGFRSLNLSTNDNLTFTEKVLDFSYMEEGRYTILDSSTLQVGKPESLQLSAGCLIYLPEDMGNGLMGFSGEIVSMTDVGDWVEIRMKEADAQDVLKNISIEDNEMQADWENAEWAEGITVVEEKLGGSKSGSGSVNLTFTKEKGPAKFTVSGSLSVKAEAKIDYDVWNSELKECSVIVNPTFTVTGGVKISGDNKDSNTSSVGLYSVEVYLGKVPVISVAKLMSIDFAVYMKVSASGEVTVTFKVAGAKAGVEWNRAASKFEKVWEMETPKLTLDLKGEIEIGPAAAFELNVVILGKLMSVEYFNGLHIEAEYSTEHAECIDADIDAKRSLEYEIKCDLSKIKKGLTWGYKVSLYDRRIDLFDWHYEIGKGKVDECTYDSVYDVDFCTFTSQKIESQRLNAEETVKKPVDPALSGNEFLGWYTDKTYETEWDFDSPVVSDLTLYARWSKTAKTVLFSSNYEGAVDATEEYIPGSKLIKPIDLKRMDYVFEGWFKDPQASEEWDFSTDVMPDSNLTLYAGWTYQEGYNPFLDNAVGSEILDYNGHQYQIFSYAGSFDEANALCQSLGGYLATITSAEENAAVYEFLVSQGYYNAYFGLTDRETEGVWKWANGEAFSYVNWAGGEPNNSNGNENYGMFYYKFDGTWNDGDWEWGTTQGNYHSFICEWGDYTIDEENINYVTDSESGEMAITGSAGKETDVLIDSVHEGTLVTSIGNSAFRNDTVLTTLSIPNTISSIGDYAFAGCTNLEEIVLPDSVTSIGAHAFDGCTSLRKVTLSGGIVELPEYVFYGCTSLEEVNRLDQISSIGAYAFYNCKALETVLFSENLTFIGNYAFYDCTSVKNVKLPGRLTSLGTNAFRGCTGLTYLVIPESLKTLSSYVFYQCTGLKTILIPESVTSIGSNAFTNVNGVFQGYTGSYAETWCSNNSKNFTAIDNRFPVRYFTGLSGTEYSMDGMKEETMTDDILVEGGTRLTEPVVEREGYKLEGWYTDSEYSSKWDFSSDTMPFSQLTLYAKWLEADAAFEYTVENGMVTVTGYTGTSEEVAIPDTLGGYPVVKLAAQSFSGNTTVRKVTLPASLAEIEPEAFEGCSSLYSIEIEAGNTDFVVNNGILYSSDGAELIYLAEGRTLVSFVVPDAVTAIYSGAFAGQQQLTRVEIPDSVADIGENAFPVSSFLTLYGAVDECAAKTYAERNGISYNLYRVTYYDGDEAKYSATWQAGTKIDSYYEPISDFSKFGGWYQDTECTDQWDFETDLMPAANLSLYLKWDSDFEVVLNGDNVTIIGYTGTLSDLVIPETLNGYPVTGIASGAFVSTAEAPFKSITIPASVDSIETGAITGAPAPQIIGDSGSAAEDYAGNAGLSFEVRSYKVTFDTAGGAELSPLTAVPGETLNLPTPVRSNYHFMGWYTSSNYEEAWDEEALMPANDMTLYAYWKIVNSNVTNSFSYEVLEDGTACITEYTGSKISLSVPETINGITVSSIGAYAFHENNTVLTIFIPDTVTSVGSYAFADSSIRIVNGGEEITTLGQGCFSGAAGLTDLSFLDQVQVIPENAFRGCSSLTDIEIPKGVTAVEAYAFYGCEYLSSISFPESLSEIGAGAFVGCKRLTSVKVPGTLKELDEDVFDEDVAITYTAASALKLLKVKQITRDSVNLEWNEVEGADGYYLYRRQGSDGTYSLIKTVTGTSTGNYNLVSGMTYYYKVQAYTLDGTTRVKGVESDESAITISALTTPEISDIVQTSAASAEMRWNGIRGAEGYEVYRSYTRSGEYTRLKTVDGTTTENTGLLGGMTYYYKIRAYCAEEGETVYSDWSEPYRFLMSVKYMNVPENLAVRMTAPGTVYLSWDMSDGADGYDLYRRKENGSYSLVKSVTETETYNYNLSSGSTYSYKISAYYYADGVKVSGEQSDAVSVDILTVGTPYVKSISQSAAGTALIKWSSVGSADGYELYRSRTANATYSLMKSVTGIETSNYNLVSGVTYYYKVRAYVEDENGNRVYGAYSLPEPILISDLAQTRIKSVVQVDGSSAKVTWAALSNADGYEVWRSTRDNAHYEFLRSTGGSAVQDRDLKDGMIYYYKIRAYKNTEKEVIYGTFSDELSVRVIATPEITLAEQIGSGVNEVMWNSISSADGYEVWSSTEADGTYELVNNAPVASAKIYNLEEGVTYFYRVRAYYENGSDKVYSNFSKIKCIKVMGIPEITRVSQNGANAVAITWKAAAAAEGYELYRAVQEAGPYEKIKNVDGTSTGNYSLDEGGEYYYRIRAFSTVDDQKQYGPYSESMGIVLLKTPVITSIEQKSISSCEIRWNEVEHATAYKLYRSVRPDSGFTLVKTVTGTVTMNYSLTADTAYYYKIKAVLQQDSRSYDSAYSQPEEVYITSMEKPKIQTLTQDGDSSVAVSWNAVNGAEGYEIWRSENESDDYSKVAVSEVTEYTDTNLNHDTDYHYMVRAYTRVDDYDGLVYGMFGGDCAIQLLSAPVIQNVYQQATTYAAIQWSESDDAEGYELWRSVNSGAYEKVKTVSGTSTTNYSLAEGNIYSYRIRSYQTINGTKSYSPFSEEAGLTVVKFTHVDGVYQIDTAEALNCFSRLIDAGETSASAVLTKDITASDDYVPIGALDHMFCGTFDGNGHTVTLNISSSEECQGLIGMAGGGAVIRNIIVDGSVTGSRYVGGIVGGSSGTGTVIVEDCWNKASVTANGINAAGIFGCNLSYNIKVILEDCYNTGEISGYRESGTISGWLGSGAEVKNCCNVGVISGYQSGRSFARYNSSVTFTNCYQLDTVGTQSDITAVTEEQLVSGEISYMLGEAWGQIIGTDEMPVLHGVKVYQNNVYACDGTTVVSKTYNNAEMNIIQDHIDIEGDGICDNCGAIVTT